MKFILALLGYGALLVSGARVRQLLPFQAGFPMFPQFPQIPQEQIDAIIAQIGEQVEDVEEFVNQQIQILIEQNNKFNDCLKENECGPIDAQCAFDNCAPPELKQLAEQLMAQAKQFQEANQQFAENVEEFFSGQQADAVSE